MSEDKPKIAVRETVKLEKFEGDDRTQPPFEIIELTLENGQVVDKKVTRREEQDAINKSG